MALILGRKVGEKILVGEDIVITVKEICKTWGHVKIAFDAPEHIKILREEIVGIPYPKHLSKEDLKCLPQHNTTL